MKKKLLAGLGIGFKSQFILLSLISILFLSAPMVNALDIRFEGVVVGGNTDIGTPIGSKFWGSYEIFPTMTDSKSTDPNRGMYRVVNFSAFFDDTDVPEGKSGFSGGGALIVVNDYLGQGEVLYDIYNLNSSTNWALPAGSGANSIFAKTFNIALYDYGATVFSDDRLPYEIPDLNDFDYAIWNIYFFNGQMIHGDITSMSNAATPTPEPATMLLMGTGLAGLIVARRKKKA